MPGILYIQNPRKVNINMWYRINKALFAQNSMLVKQLVQK